MVVWTGATGSMAEMYCEQHSSILVLIPSSPVRHIEAWTLSWKWRGERADSGNAAHFARRILAGSIADQ